MADARLSQILDKHRAFWKRDMTEGPLLNVLEISSASALSPLQSIEMPLANGTMARESMPLKPEMIDPRLILDFEEFPTRAAREGEQIRGVIDDLFIRRSPVWKMPWVEAILGCPVVFGAEAGSIWSQPYLDHPSQIDKLPSLEDNAWLEKLLEYTRVLVEESGGEYQVSQCLMRGTVDLVAALLGHYQMCASLYDHPKELRRLTEHCADVFVKVAKAQEALIPQFHGGRISSFGIWAPGTIVMTQADASAAMSARAYEEFFFLYEIEICRQFDFSALHLHSGFLHTVDVMLKTEYPTAVQVALDTGSTPVTVHDLIPTFQKVLDKKPLLVMGIVTSGELEELRRTLPDNGLYISALIKDD